AMLLTFLTASRTRACGSATALDIDGSLANRGKGRGGAIAHGARRGRILFQCISRNGAGDLIRDEFAEQAAGNVRAGQRVGDAPAGAGAVAGAVGSAAVD